MAESLSKDKKLALFERMLLMRRFEEMVIHMAAAHKYIGRNHLYIGHEATGAAALGLLAAGRPDLYHPPQPWPSHRARRRSGQGAGRDHGPRGRPERRARRHLASVRHLDRLPFDLGHGRRQHRPLRSAAAIALKHQGKGRVSGRAVRRRHARRGHRLRGAQLRLGVRAAGSVPVREQQQGRPAAVLHAGGQGARPTCRKRAQHAP